MNILNVVMPQNPLTQGFKVQINKDIALTAGFNINSFKGLMDYIANAVKSGQELPQSIISLHSIFTKPTLMSDYTTSFTINSGTSTILNLVNSNDNLFEGTNSTGDTDLWIAITTSHKGNGSV